MRTNHEITKKQPLLENGQLREAGWSRRMVQQYRRADIRAPRFRIKEWDYYLIIADEDAVALTISDDGYIGLQSVSLLHLGEGAREHTETVLNAFPMGRLHLPETSETGVTEYRDKRLSMSFTADGKTRRIRCNFENFHEEKTFSCDITLQQPDMDSLVIATPFDKKGRFYYNQKINCMPASGWAEFDGQTICFDPERHFGTLDWGRGVWTYDNTWYWGSGNGYADGHVFGFNLGYGFGNTSAASENVIFADGIAHKLEDVTFEIPASSYTDPWRITSSDGRFSAYFEPVLDRAAKIDAGLILSDQHQVFGKLSGKAVLDGGEVLRFSDILCFFEKVHNKY